MIREKLQDRLEAFGYKLYGNPVSLRDYVILTAVGKVTRLLGGNVLPGCSYSNRCNRFERLHLRFTMTHWGVVLTRFNKRYNQYRVTHIFDHKQPRLCAFFALVQDAMTAEYDVNSWEVFDG